MFWPVARLLSGGTVGPVRQHISSLCIDFPPCCVRRPVRGCPRQPVWWGGTWGSGRGRRFLAIAEPRAVPAGEAERREIWTAFPRWGLSGSIYPASA
jgi:hypothetical protein